MLYLNPSRISREGLVPRLNKFLGKGLCFDLDGVIVDIKQNTGTDYFDWTWNAMERKAGFHEDKKHQSLKWKWIELYEKHNKGLDEENEVTKLQEALDKYWEGKYFDEVTRPLFPIPWMKNFEKFMEKLRAFNLKDERKFKIGIVTAAPELYAKKVAEALGMDVEKNYISGVYVGVDDKGRMTGEFTSIKTSTRINQVLGFCCYNNLNLGEMMYHDDSISGLEALSLAGFSVAVRPEENGKGARLRKATHITLTDGNWLEHPLIHVLEEN